MSRSVASAKATVTVEISELGTWGRECKLDQIYDQAAEAAIDALSKALQGEGIRIIGRPKVTAIFVSERAGNG